MTQSEIRNKIKELMLKNAEILDSIEKETRKATNVETISMDTNTVEIRSLEAELKNAEKIEIKVGENRAEKGFSVAEAIVDIVEQRKQSEATTAINARGHKQFAMNGLEYNGQIILPVEKRSEILAGTSTQGSEIVVEDALGLITGLRANSVLFKAGATFYSGLKNNLVLPVYTNSSSAWVTEVGDNSDGAGSFTDVTWSPKRISGYIDISKQFLIQDSANAEAVLKADFLASVLSKLEYTFLQAASGNTTQPAGIFNGVTDTSTGTTSWAKVVALETAINTSNALMGNLSYITTPALKGTFKTTAKASNTAAFIQEAETINGYPIYTSSNVATGRIAYGNWADFVIAQFGGIDLLVDFVTQAGKGKIRIHVNAYFDGKRRRDASFAYGSLT